MLPLSLFVLRSCFSVLPEPFHVTLVRLGHPCTSVHLSSLCATLVLLCYSCPWCCSRPSVLISPFCATFCHSVLQLPFCATLVLLCYSFCAALVLVCCSRPVLILSFCAAFRVPCYSRDSVPLLSFSGALVLLAYSCPCVLL